METRGRDELVKVEDMDVLMERSEGALAEATTPEDLRAFAVQAEGIRRTLRGMHAKLAKPFREQCPAKPLRQHWRRHRCVMLR